MSPLRAWSRDVATHLDSDYAGGVMAVNPALFGFSAEFRGDPRTYDGFDEYLRIEFPKLHQGWEPRFGRATWFDPSKDRHDYAYLISGNVPDATSHPDAQSKVASLLDDLARGFKGTARSLSTPYPRRSRKSGPGTNLDS
jgi:hypothetical protein